MMMAFVISETAVESQDKSSTTSRLFDITETIEMVSDDECIFFG